MIELEANCVGVAEQDDTLVVGFADLNTKGIPRDHLLLMRSLDEGEDVPGIGGVAVEINDQARMTEDGITAFRLHRDRATLRFTKRAMKDLDIDNPNVVILFQVDDKKFAELRAALGQVFRGCRCYSDRELE